MSDSFLRVLLMSKSVLSSRLKFIVKSYPFKVPQECSTDVFADHFQTAAFPFLSLFSLIYQIPQEGSRLETLAVVSLVKVLKAI